MDDIPMENVEGADNRTDYNEMAESINTGVFEHLKEKLKDGNEMMEKKDIVFASEMVIYFDANNNVLELDLHPVLRQNILRSYHVKLEVADTVAKETAAEAAERYGAQLPLVPQPTPEDLERLEIAFTQTKYIGNASSDFKKYLERCWKMHCPNTKLFKAPYVAVVQSSGFGKSRMLYELARGAQESNSMKVLYVCARTQKSSGYPKATPELRKWLFPSSCTSKTIADRLNVIFQHAVNNWKSVQEEWLNLFTSTDADQGMKKKLDILEETMSREKIASTSGSPSGEVKSSKKVVVVVIDEARSLLAEEQNCLSQFRMLRRALQATKGCVFGVLVDTNSKISDLTPPQSSDPSSRSMGVKDVASFPPFVLTHTMDIFWQQHCNEQTVQGEQMRDNDEMDMQNKAVEAADKVADDEMSGDQTSDSKGKADGKKEMSADITAYKDAVTGSEENAWDALIRMGRPMWYSGKVTRVDVVDLAANKLLLGLSPGTGSYIEANMFGIASLLCRVGLRPYSTSSFAPRAVADFMAILAYVNYEKEGYVSSYASDPVLAFGAIKVWYSLEDAVAKFILPQLKKLILNEALDTGAIGEVVARIVLLLAMDKCVMPGKTYDPTMTARAGAFIPVHAFLKAFSVDEMPVFMSRMRAATSDTKDAFRTWLSKWDGWQMGFTHFVQLRLEPTEETLWYLLGRRAAGIFPRNQKGADLLIPIFWKKTDGEAASESEMKTEDAVDALDAKVSLILIQVKNRAPHDSEFPKSATTKLCPSFVFGEKLKKPKKVPAKTQSAKTPAKRRIEESFEGSPMEDVEGSSMEDVEGSLTEKPVEDPPIRKLENPLSKKSVRDVICIYMNVQEEDSKHHQFIYASTIDDKKKRNDGSGAKLADTSGENKTSNCMEAASSSTSVGRKLSEVGDLKAESAEMASGSNDSKTEVASKLRFTLCYRSICCGTYTFLDTEVADRLASLVETLWDPLVLVDGDLKHRQEVEKQFKKDSSKAFLSQAMGDKELKKIACNGLADPPGRQTKQQSSDPKRDQGDQRGDSRKHQCRV